MSGRRLKHGRGEMTLVSQVLEVVVMSNVANRAIFAGRQASKQAAGWLMQPTAVVEGAVA